MGVVILVVVGSRTMRTVAASSFPTERTQAGILLNEQSNVLLNEQPNEQPNNNNQVTRVLMEHRATPCQQNTNSDTPVTSARTAQHGLVNVGPERRKKVIGLCASILGLLYITDLTSSHFKHEKRRRYVPKFTRASLLRLLFAKENTPWQRILPSGNDADFILSLSSTKSPLINRILPYFGQQRRQQIMEAQIGRALTLEEESQFYAQLISLS